MRFARVTPVLIAPALVEPVLIASARVEPVVLESARVDPVRELLLDVVLLVRELLADSLSRVDVPFVEGAVVTLVSVATDNGMMLSEGGDENYIYIQ